jgi:hypothetical protein
MTDNHSSEQKQVHLYEKFLESLVEKLKPAEQSVLHTIESLKESLSSAEEHTKEEIDKVSHYLRRDLHDAASYLAETGEELEQWLKFDAGQVERRAFELFLQVADKTQLELQQWQEQAKTLNLWKTGEVTSMGTLCCTACGHSLHFKKAGHIPPCGQCKGTEFSRKS